MNKLFKLFLACLMLVLFAFVFIQPATAQRRRPRPCPTHVQWCFQIPSDHVMVVACQPSQEACEAQRRLMVNGGTANVTECVRREVQ